MKRYQQELADSELKQAIAPEIRPDAFCDIIKRFTATETLETVLAIGSSAGGETTEAFVAGLSQNPGSPKLFCIEISVPRFQKLRETYKSYPFVHCYNRSTLSVDQFPKPEVVTAFYHGVESGLRKFPLPDVLDRLRQEIQYVAESGVRTGAIEKIKADHGIKSFDMVLIDGSEFGGEVDYTLIQGAKIVLLDDTNTFKCYKVRQTLLNDPMYDLVADDQELRNGYSVFRRRATARRIDGSLPIHFFTIVLNGEPFIRYHEEVFRRLTVHWHWHIVEGVASLKHDTAWSVASGGHIPDSVHDRGRSNDGTSAYLDDLARRYPENVTIYRKPLDKFWDGKREMVNAPLPHINEPCLLWQVDNDELWTVEQIQAVHDLFTRNPARTAAYYWCWYYVGPDKIISTRYNYAQNPKQEWLRTWRYAPGATWAAHEPPMLVAAEARDPAKAVDIAMIAPFTQDEMEEAGAVFHHFAYATESQLIFKELYYGYRDARAQWRALQAHKGSGALRDFLEWVPDETLFDDAVSYLIDPIAKADPATGVWKFDGAGLLPEAQRETAVARPRIVVDGLFWQDLSSGIGRVWQNLLREWVASGFADNVVVLDRAGTAPRIRGAHYWTIARRDHQQIGRDSLYLEAVCRQLDADIFVSTYYSTPTATPSFFSGYDMIPEVLGFNLDEDAWQEKRRAVLHAAAHSMISQNSADDLEAAYPSVARGSTYVAHCGADPNFYPPPGDEIDAFCARHGLARQSYVLTVGERHGVAGYKNCVLVFRALAELGDRAPVLICTGGRHEIEPHLRALAPNLDVRRLILRDDELRAAYAGAHALLYPSKYEGFGMPPLESMACGTPAIVCRNSSIPEVVGDAALFVDDSDPAGMADAILQLYDPDLRADLIQCGLRQAATFTFSEMAQEMAQALVETYDRLQAGEIARPGTAWSELRNLQQRFQARGGRLDAVEGSKTEQTLASNVTAQAEPDQVQQPEARGHAGLRGAIRCAVMELQDWITLRRFKKKLLKPFFVLTAQSQQVQQAITDRFAALHQDSDDKFAALSHELHEVRGLLNEMKSSFGGNRRS
jgi:glycosyltransferase involved in cell wall biosynthesis